MEIMDGFPATLRRAIKSVWMNKGEMFDILRDFSFGGVERASNTIYHLRLEDLSLHQDQFNVTLSPRISTSRSGDRYFPAISPRQR